MPDLDPIPPLSPDEEFEEQLWQDEHGSQPTPPAVNPERRSELTALGYPTIWEIPF
jgi:hypothetical protein